MEKMTTQETLRQLRHIVNNLTPENFDELMKSVADLNFDTGKKLREAIKLIFFKAVLEPSYTTLYVRMCCCLKELKVDTMTGESVTFCTLLETRCQQQLKKVHSGDEDLNRMEKELDSAQNEAEFMSLKLELDEARLKAHHRLLGSMKFIGELFKVKMLTLDIICNFVLELLSDDQHELSMECLCTLLSTIGEELDTENTKPLLDNYFCRLENTIKDSRTSAKIQLMLRDVLDLRKNKWVPPLYEEVPQAVKQMHQEGRLEEQRDAEQRKGRSVTKDQTTQTQPMSDQSRDGSSHNKGPVDCSNWPQRRARSLTRRSDWLVHPKNRCRSDGRGVNHFRHASHSENWHFRSHRAQSSGKPNQHSSEYDNWCRRRAHNSSHERDRIVRFNNRPQGEGYRVPQVKYASECDRCGCRSDPSRDGARHAKQSDAETWHKRTARSSSPQRDQPVPNKSRFQSVGQSVYHSVGQSVGHRANRFRQGSGWEDCGARNDRRQDGVKHGERPSDAEKWRKRTAHGSPFPSEQPVTNKDRGHSNVHSGDKPKHASENRYAPNDRSRDGVRSNERPSDADHWRKTTARDSPFPSEQPVSKQDRCHGNVHSGDKSKRPADCENWCSRNDHGRDERPSDLDSWHKTTVHGSAHGSEWPASSTNRPHGDGRGFNPFRQASYCENCHSRNDCGRDSVKPSDCENWRIRRAHNSYRPGVHFVINKNWRHASRYWINPFKRATHVRNWRPRSERNKDGFKDSDRSSYCKNWRRRNPHGASRYAIWAIFNRKLSHKTHGNRQAVAQFKSDCENWRSWNDRHRDHVDQRQGSPEDKNWRSRGDCGRDQVEHCDRSPDRDVTDQGERDEQRVADSNEDRRETAVQKTQGSDTDERQCGPSSLAAAVQELTIGGNMLAQEAEEDPNCQQSSDDSVFESPPPPF